MIVRIILLFLCLLQTSGESTEANENITEGFQPPVLLRPKRMNCTAPIIEQFPRSMISMLLKGHTVAAACAHTLVAIYALVSMILVYKNLFLRSIDLICKEQKYSPSVIGATYMAVGSAMPEFAKNMIGVYTAREYIGVVGVFPSVFYNIPYVLMLGICSFFAKKEHNVQCWSFYRDSFFYILSILGLCFATFNRVIVWWKCVIMLSVYLVYCIVLCLNPAMEKMVHSFTNLSKCCRKNEPTEIELSEVQRNDNELARQSVQQNLLTNVNQEFSRNNEFDENDNPSTTIRNIRISPRCFGLFSCIMSCLFPILPLCKLITSSCENRSCLKSYKILYVISLIWLFLFSFLMHWKFVNTGSILKIPDTILNFTVVFASLSIIGIMNSVVAIKRGFADMAISNAIGADIFSICISLGFPWFLETGVLRPTSSIPLSTEKLWYFMLSTLISIIAVMGTICLNNQKLDSNLGRALVGLFIIYNTLVFILNAFRHDDILQCETIY